MLTLDGWNLYCFLAVLLPVVLFSAGLSDLGALGIQKLLMSFLNQSKYIAKGEKNFQYLIDLGILQCFYFFSLKKKALIDQVL